MIKTTILVADNDEEYRATLTEFLEREDYRVLQAASPIEAKQLLEENHVDLAILDLRLENDKDPKDRSGLDMAKQVAPTIPKIILTGFPDTETLREALGIVDRDLPPATRYIYKSEGMANVRQAVNESLTVAKRLRRSINVASEQITSDYEDVHRHTKWDNWTSRIVAVLGIGVIFTGTFLALNGRVEVGIASAIAGLIAQGITYLFFKRLDAANERLDRYHLELLQVQRFEILLAACGELSLQQENASKEKIIQRAMEHWLSAHAPQIQSPAIKAESQEGQP